MHRARQSAMWCLRSTLAVLALVMGPSGSAIAMDKTAERMTFRPGNERRCKIHAEGPIGHGDGERLQAVLETTPLALEEEPVLCLDSLGGNLAAGIRLAEVVYDAGWTTYIAAGAECLSACAYVFMAGQLQHAEQRAIYRRILHPEGRLAFHRPVLPDGVGNVPVSSFETVQEPYDAAIENVLDIVALANRRPNGEAFPMMRSDLLQQVFSQEDGWLEIDTVDEAGRWDITVEGILPARLDRESATHACAHYSKWIDSGDAEFPETLVYADLPDPFRPDGFVLVLGPGTGYWRHDCLFAESFDWRGFPNWIGCIEDDVNRISLGSISYSADYTPICDRGTVAQLTNPLLGYAGDRLLVDLPRTNRLTPPTYGARFPNNCSPGTRVVVSSGGELANLRAAPSLNAAVLARVSHLAQLAVLDPDPVFTGTAATRSRCNAQCESAQTPPFFQVETFDGRLGACIDEHHIWYRVRALPDGPEGYMSAAILQ